MTRMNRPDDFAPTVSAWLHEDARHHAPDDLDAVLRRTRTERQRPAWSSLERWLPVQTTLRFSPVPRVAWILVVLALVIALGVAAALTIGSRPHPLPPPFGPARNGLIVYGGSDHDIHALDLATGTTTSLITGTEGDHRPVLSPDGTKVLFLRDTTTIDMVIGGYEPMIMVANGDGTNVHALTGSPRERCGSPPQRRLVQRCDQGRGVLRRRCGPRAPGVHRRRLRRAGRDRRPWEDGRIPDVPAGRPGDHLPWHECHGPRRHVRRGRRRPSFRTIIGRAEGDGTSRRRTATKIDPLRPGRRGTGKPSLVAGTGWREHPVPPRTPARCRSEARHLRGPPVMDGPRRRHVPTGVR